MGARLSWPSEQLSSVRVLEDLSNDLLLELFDYFWSHEIDLSFGHLNSRFDSLIVSYPQHVNLQLGTTIPHSIRSLKLTVKYPLSLFYSFDRRRTSLIRALTLANLRPQQMLDVLNLVDVKRLEYVYLGMDYDTGKLSDDMESVQTRVLSLSEYRLRRCRLRGHLLVNIDRLPSTLPALEYLHLDNCRDFSVLSFFLSRLANLKFVQVSISNSTENPLQSVSCRLTHLILRPHWSCSKTELRRFLATCCSHVKRLIIESLIKNGEPARFSMSKHEWSSILPSSIIWFHLKAMPIWNDDLLPRAFGPTTLHDQIRFTSNEHCHQPCQVTVDTPFLFRW